MQYSISEMKTFPTLKIKININLNQNFRFQNQKSDKCQSIKKSHNCVGKTWTWIDLSVKFLIFLIKLIRGTFEPEKLVNLIKMEEKKFKLALIVGTSGIEQRNRYIHYLVLDSREGKFQIHKNSREIFYNKIFHFSTKYM